MGTVEYQGNTYTLETTDEVDCTNCAFVNDDYCPDTLCSGYQILKLVQPERVLGKATYNAEGLGDLEHDIMDLCDCTDLPMDEDGSFHRGTFTVTVTWEDDPDESD